MLRPSSYTIVELFDENRYILAHGYTGALDIVPAKVGLTLKNKYAQPETELSDKTIECLCKRGYLTSLSKADERSYFLRIAQTKEQYARTIAKKHFTIVVTYDCNFNCPYCFEKELFPDSEAKRKVIISRQMVDKIYDCIPEIESNQARLNPVIMLFGGEPLLSANKDIIEYIVDKGRRNGYIFTATSNGYDLDAFQHLLGQNGIKSIQITLDGIQHTHDSRRGHSITGESYDKILSNIKKALDYNTAIRVRVNSDSQNYKDLSNLERELDSKGILKHPAFSIYAEYISGGVNFNPSTYAKPNARFTRKDFIEHCESVTHKTILDDRIYGNINNAIKNKTSLSLLPMHCTAHFGSYIFDPFGKIYSCYDEIGKPDAYIGTYSDGLSWNEPIKNKWFGKSIMSAQRCPDCKYGLLCGGGCFSKTLISGNNRNYCDEFPLRFSSALRRTVRQMTI